MPKKNNGKYNRVMMEYIIVVYKLSCSESNSFYVGQIGRLFKISLDEHISYKL